MAGRFVLAREVLQRAVAERAFPAAVVEVGRSNDVLWREAFGRLSVDADAPPTCDETIFDLGSLTKVLSTATIALRQVERGAIGLDDPVSAHIAAWNEPSRQAVTIRDLLSHCSGLPAHVPIFLHHKGRAEFEAAAQSGEIPVPSGEGWYAPYMFSKQRYLDIGGIDLDDTDIKEADGFNTRPLDIDYFLKHKANGGVVLRARSYVYHLQHYSEPAEQEKSNR